MSEIASEPSIKAHRPDLTPRRTPLPIADITIINRLGLHARAAAKLVQTASAYSSTVLLTKGEKTINGKSIMGVMMLAAAQGAEIRISTEGGDEEEALASLVTLINEKFGEPS